MFKKHLFQRDTLKSTQGAVSNTIWDGQGRNERVGNRSGQIYIVFLLDASVLADFLGRKGKEKENSGTGRS